MKKVRFLIPILAFGFATFPVLGEEAQSAGAFDYAPLERVLRQYVDADGRVNYAALKKNRGDLDQMVEQIRRISPENSPQVFPARESKLAYWINAYNVLVLRVVVDKYPIKSITRIGLIPYGAFFIKKVELAGKRMTLRTLENDIIRARFREPRIHFAINCASTSCPPLRREVYRPETLDAQLDAATHDFLNDNRHVTLDQAGKRIRLSKIFDWYSDDFQQGGESVVEYVKRYLTEGRRKILEKLAGARISFHDYDWSLNDQVQAP